ncbi:MAG: glycosyltransferase family 39 protein, partial [Pseudomonadota bacterium]
MTVEAPLKTGSRLIPKNIRLSVWILLAAIILVGLSLSLNRLEEKSLWQDEITTVQIASSGIPQIYQSLEGMHMAPPLYYLVLHYFLKIGSNEVIARLPSVFFFVLSIFGCFLVATLLFDKTVALLAALLFALSPLQIQYAQEARMYSMCQFFLLMSFFFLLKALESHKPAHWIFYIVMTALGAYTHYFVLFYLFIQGLILIGMTWKQLVSSFKEKSGRLKEAFKPLLWFAAGLFCVFLLYLPRMSSSLARSQGAGLEQSFSQSLEQTLRFFGGALKNDLPPLYILLFVWGITASWLAGKNKEGLQASVWALLPFPLIFLFLTVANSFFAVRYVLFSHAPYLILISFGLVYAVRQVHLLWKPSIFLKKIFTAICVLIVCAVHIAPIQAMYKRPKQPWRELVVFLNKNVEPTEAVFISPQWQWILLDYYGFKSKRITPINLGDIDQYAKEKNNAWILYMKREGTNEDEALVPYIESGQCIHIIGNTFYSTGIYLYYLNINEDQSRKMIPLFKDAIDIIPRDWFVYLNYGEALLDDGQIKEAIRVL